MPSSAWLERLLPDADLAGEYLAMASLFELIKDDGPKIIIALMLVFIALCSSPQHQAGHSAVVFGHGNVGGRRHVGHGHQALIAEHGSPIMMGIGIDIIIHLLHRIDEEVEPVDLLPTGWAAVLTPPPCSLLRCSSLKTVDSLWSDDRGWPVLGGHHSLLGTWVGLVCGVGEGRLT